MATAAATIGTAVRAAASRERMDYFADNCGHTRAGLQHSAGRPSARIVTGIRLGDVVAIPTCTAPVSHSDGIAKPVDVVQNLRGGVPRCR